MYFLRVYLIKTSSAVSLNTATESGIIRWQIDKAASIALASSNWHTLLTPVQEAFRMNKNLVSYFFFFFLCILTSAYAWVQTIPTGFMRIERHKTPPQSFSH